MKISEIRSKPFNRLIILTLIILSIGYYVTLGLNSAATWPTEKTATARVARPITQTTTSSNQPTVSSPSDPERLSSQIVVANNQAIHITGTLTGIAGDKLYLTNGLRQYIVQTSNGTTISTPRGIIAREGDHLIVIGQDAGNNLILARHISVTGQSTE